MLNPKTKEIISSKQVDIEKHTKAHLEPPVAMTKTIEPTVLLDHICEKTELTSILKKSFPED